MFARMADLVDQELKGIRFAPVLEEEPARQLAREGMLKCILRKRGIKPSVLGISAAKLFYAPVWIYYFRSFGGKIDLAVLDGYSGEPMGGLVRRSVVDGLIAQSAAASRKGV